MTKPTILFQDSDILVLAKPPGLIINRAETVKSETLQDWLKVHWEHEVQSTDWQTLVPADFNSEYGTPETIFQERIGIVHRLDKDTSGILVVAKNPGSLVNLLAQFKQRRVVKTYVCLVHGKLRFETGEIQVPLGRQSGDRKKFGVRAEGRPAVTEYRLEKFYPHLNVDEVQALKKVTPERDWPPNLPKRLTIYQGFSLVTCWPKTGRTHQIRVHLAHLGHPLVGDTTYVGKKRQKLDPLWCPRQFLHAAELTFFHPRTGEQLQFQAPLPDDLTQVLALLAE